MARLPSSCAAAVDHMKIDLSIPSLNVICDTLKALQQQCAVAQEAIVAQVQAQQAELDRPAAGHDAGDKIEQAP